MTTMMQIWPMTEVRSRIQDDPSITEIRVVSGHTNKSSGMIVMNIKKANDQWNDRLLDKLEQHRGYYTAFLFPTKEVLWLEGTTNDQKEFNYMYPYSEEAQQIAKYGNADMRSIVTELIQAKEIIAKLQQENEDLKEDLKEFETASGKFEHAIGNVFMTYVLPLFSGSPKKHNLSHNRAMQGQQEENKVDFTQLPLRDQGDGGVQDALTILYEALGDELLVKIAQRLQREPGLVNTLRTFIG